MQFYSMPLRPRLSDFAPGVIEELKEIFSVDIQLYENARKRHMLQAAELDGFSRRVSEWDTSCDQLKTSKYDPQERVRSEVGEPTDTEYKCDSSRRLSRLLSLE